MRAPKPTWQKRLLWWSWGDRRLKLLGECPDWLCDLPWFPRAICLVTGNHSVIDDQCGRPEHRFCYKCNHTMPHAPLEA